MIAAKFAEGMTYREIGEMLFIAPATVRTHLSAIYRKLNVRSKVALAALLADRRLAAGPRAPAASRPSAHLQVRRVRVPHAAEVDLLVLELRRADLRDLLVREGAEGDSAT